MPVLIPTEATTVESVPGSPVTSPSRYSIVAPATFSKAVPVPLAHTTSSSTANATAATPRLQAARISEWPCDPNPDLRRADDGDRSNPRSARSITGPYEEKNGASRHERAAGNERGSRD